MLLNADNNSDFPKEVSVKFTTPTQNCLITRRNLQGTDRRTQVRGIRTIIDKLICREEKGTVLYPHQIPAKIAHATTTIIYSSLYTARRNRVVGTRSKDFS